MSFLPSESEWRNLKGILYKEEISPCVPFGSLSRNDEVIIFYNSKFKQITPKKCKAEFISAVKHFYDKT